MNMVEPIRFPARLELFPASSDALTVGVAPLLLYSAPYSHGHLIRGLGKFGTINFAKLY